MIKYTPGDRARVRRRSQWHAAGTEPTSREDPGWDLSEPLITSKE